MLHLLPIIGMLLIFRRAYSEIGELRAGEWFYFFLIALFGGALGTLAIVKALFLVNFKHLTVVALLQKLQPLFAIILARVLLGERIGRRFVFWALVAISAGYLLTFQFTLPVLAGDGKVLPAALYSLLAAFSFGSATVFGKRVLNRVSFQTALFLRYGLTSLIMVAIVAFRGAFNQVAVTTPLNWTFLVVIGLTTGSGAILLYYYGLRYVRASVATICELCFPVSTVLFDYFINGHLITPLQWASALLMLYAILRISQDRARIESECDPGSQWCQAA
jgi:drug/metabolite transporter (DMT)-like permease